jgi:hypothetical protein
MDDKNSSLDLKRSYLIINIGVAAVLGLLLILGAIMSIGNKPAEVSVPEGSVTGFEISKNQIIQEEKFLSGVVSDVKMTNGESGTIALKAFVTDISFAGDYIRDSERKFVERDVVVAVNANGTEGSGLLRELQAGDKINVSLSESVHLAETPTAIALELYDKTAQERKQILGNVKQLTGTVLSQSETEIVVEAYVVDTEILDTLDLSGSYATPYVIREFTVLLSEDTVISYEDGGPFDESLVDEGVAISVGQDIYTSKTLSAKTISIVLEEDEF